MDRDIFQKSHKRFNPLTEEWILCSPHRLKRPWQGKLEEIPPEERPRYDPDCYLCPGNERAGGNRNPDYQGTFVFDNDFSALVPDETAILSQKEGLLRFQMEQGICRVVCYSPRHDLTMAEMEESEIRRVIDVWIRQYLEIGSLDYIGHVQIFENKGAVMGCSNHHPHGQIWATRSLPMEPEKENKTQHRYGKLTMGRCLLCDYMDLEDEEQERIVCRNNHWVALVPFWAKWPFETMILPFRHVGSLGELDREEKADLAEILRRLTTRFDNLFHTSFPYTMGIHQKPTLEGDFSHWHLHFHFYPPLLRSATVQKFMVGFEMLGTPQRDFTAEDAAQRLRSLSEIHFRKENQKGENS